MPTECAQDSISPSSPRDEAHEPQRPARKPYVAPAIRSLGSVRDLTLALSGTPMEGVIGGMMNM